MNELTTEEKLWPVLLAQDRYSGVYSGGEWVAIATADNHLQELENAVWGDDVTCFTFWDKQKDSKWIAVGKSPEEARTRLLVKNE